MVGEFCKKILATTSVEDCITLKPDLETLIEREGETSQNKFIIAEAKAHLTIRIKFDRIFDIRIDCDPVCNWINEFYCYRDFYIPERIVFDIGFYKIVCEALTAEKL